MKKVLVIAYYFPPLGGGGTLRTVKFVKYLRSFGWEPVVLTVKSPHYLAEDPWLEKQLPENLAIFRSKAFLPGRFFRKALQHSYDGENETTRPAILKRLAGAGFTFGKSLVYSLAFTPDEFVGWIPFGVRKGIEVIEQEKIDAIYTTAPPNSVHLIGRKIHRKTGLPWVADFRDLWNQYPESYNPFGWRWKVHLDDRFEKKVLQDCQRALVVSATMKRELVHKYPQVEPEKIRVVTNGFDPSDIEGLLPLRMAPEKFVVTHAGTLFAWRKSAAFFRVLQKLVRENEAFAKNFRLLLPGIVHSEVRAEIRRLGLEPWVDIQGYKNYPDMMRILLGSDVLLLIIGNQPHAANVLTLKLFDYMNARCPILALAPEGEVSRLVQKHRLGRSCLPADEAAIANALLDYFSDWRQKKLAWQGAGDLSAFHRKRLTGQLAEILNEVTS